jgi:hypothetical protein
MSKHGSYKQGSTKRPVKTWQTGGKAEKTCLGHNVLPSLKGPARAPSRQKTGIVAQLCVIEGQSWTDVGVPVQQLAAHQPPATRCYGMRGINVGGRSSEVQAAVESLIWLIFDLLDFLLVSSTYDSLHPSTPCSVSWPMAGLSPTYVDQFMLRCQQNSVWPPKRSCRQKTSSREGQAS